MNYLILDVEATGLPDFKKPADAAGQPRVCAIGMIFTDEKLVVEKEHGLIIKPNGWTIDPESDASKVHKITQERAEVEGIDMHEAARIYGSAIDDRRVVVGHNVTFDLKLMRAELRFCGYPDRYLQTRHICTMQGCRQLVDARTADGRKKAPKLAEACAFFGIDQGDAGHTGMGDARSALEILRRLKVAGQFPAFTDPYDRGKPKAAARPQGRAYEEMVVRDQQDFIDGASENGK